MAKRVAVIILNWNGENLLREFLPSVMKNTNLDLGRVVVVDNRSTDGSWICLEQEFPDVERVLFEENFGFAGGVGPGREGCGRAAEDISISG